MNLIYRFVRGVLRLGLRAYFRDIEVHGASNVPKEGPLVVAANHHNGMIDPFLVIAAAERPITFVAKATLFRVPLLGWILKQLHCIPAYRGEEKDYSKDKNQLLFESAGAMLAEGRALGIFPEGKSHTDPQLLEFKHGASRIAFEAEMRCPGVRIQLVGIHFEMTRGFRGKALVMFGPTLSLAAYRDRYAQDPRPATAALTEELHRRLSDMVLTAESEETMRLAELVEHMGVVDAQGDGELKTAFERKKRILEAYADLRRRAPGQIEDLRQSLRRYRDILDQLGVRDDQIADDYRFGRVISFTLRNTITLLLGLPGLAVGFACNLLPYLVSRTLAGFSSSLDMRTSIGFLSAIALFPLTWAALAVLAYVRFGGWGAAAAVAAAPLSGAFALRWMDQWHRVAQATRGLWTALTLRSARRELQRQRERILEQVRELIELQRGPTPPSEPQAGRPA